MLGMIRPFDIFLIRSRSLRIISLTEFGINVSHTENQWWSRHRKTSSTSQGGDIRERFFQRCPYTSSMPLDTTWKEKKITSTHTFLEAFKNETMNYLTRPRVSFVKAFILHRATSCTSESGVEVCNFFLSGNKLHNQSQYNLLISGREWH